MANITVKSIFALLVFSMIFEGWLFIALETHLALFILAFSILLLLIIFFTFLSEINKLERENVGLEHLLEKSEKERMNSEELKSKILLMIDDLPEGLIIANEDNEISVINRMAEKFLSVNRRQVLNKPVLDLGHLSNVKKIVIPLLFNFRGACKEEIEVRKNFILDLTVEPLVLGKNNMEKLIILRDVTKIRYAETAKNQFISVAAHQLKAPLSNIRLSLKMLLAKDFGKMSRQQKDIMEKTYKENESLIYLVEDLLKEEKISESGQLENRTLINLEDLAIPVVDFYKDGIKRKKINFKFNKPNIKLPEILADPEKIKMVIQNLLDNAIKYTPPKGKIEIDILTKKGEVEFKIKDSGIGIPENQQNKIFARFSRAVNVIKTKEAGSGLGLSIAKEIIEKYGGKIWFQSKENEGSTFFFSLPCAK